MPCRVKGQEKWDAWHCLFLFALVKAPLPVFYVDCTDMGTANMGSNSLLSLPDELQAMIIDETYQSNLAAFRALVMSSRHLYKVASKQLEEYRTLHAKFRELERGGLWSSRTCPAEFLVEIYDTPNIARFTQRLSCSAYTELPQGIYDAASAAGQYHELVGRLPIDAQHLEQLVKVIDGNDGVGLSHVEDVSKARCGVNLLLILLLRDLERLELSANLLRNEALQNVFVACLDPAVSPPLMASITCVKLDFYKEDDPDWASFLWLRLPNLAQLELLNFRLHDDLNNGQYKARMLKNMDRFLPKRASAKELVMRGAIAPHQIVIRLLKCMSLSVFSYDGFTGMDDDDDHATESKQGVYHTPMFDMVHGLQFGSRQSLAHLDLYGTDGGGKPLFKNKPVELDKAIPSLQDFSVSLNFVSLAACHATAALPIRRSDTDCPTAEPHLARLPRLAPKAQIAPQGRAPQGPPRDQRRCRRRPAALAALSDRHRRCAAGHGLLQNE